MEWNRGQFKDQLTCTDVDSCSEMMMSHQVMKRKMNGGARGGGWTRKVWFAEGEEKKYFLGKIWLRHDGYLPLTASLINSFMFWCWCIHSLTTHCFKGEERMGRKTARGLVCLWKRLLLLVVVCARPLWARLENQPWYQWSPLVRNHPSALPPMNMICLCLGGQ